MPVGHRFPIDKYKKLRERLQKYALMGVHFEFIEPHAATDAELLRVHHKDYIGRVMAGTLSKEEIRRIGFPWSQELVQRSLRSTGAAVDAALAALRDGVAASLAGGTHHAFPGHGEGFCVLNDIAVTIKILLQEKKIKKALIIDLDVHQGNGTAEALKDDINTFTFSMHCGKNYPFVKANSDLDIELDEGTGDTEYLHVLNQHVLDVLTKVNPDIVFYLAGVDVVEGDRYGRLNLSRSGLQKREQFILGLMKRLSLPVVILMSGGYATTPGITADLHAEVHRAAYTFY